jgi:hypothetical protein
MKIKLITLACFFFCVAVEAVAQVPKDISEKPQNGFVPDKETAIAIAEAVWTPLYGKKQILKERPFQAVLTNGVWIVRGSLPEGYNGGVAIAEISKATGCILRVIHEK